MKVGDIECLIEVKGGMALNEYGVQRSADGRTCMAWIPSRIDQEFSIVYHDPKFMRVTGSYPRIDGAQYKGHMLKKGEQLCVQKYVRTGPQELRRLKFGALRLTDDDDTYLLYGQRNFGEIAVDIWRCDIRPECKKVPNSYTVPPPALAHERGKKAVTHAVTFGAPILYPASRDQHIVRLSQQISYAKRKMQLDNLTCWITVNGARLEEYGIEEDDEKKERIAWIASEPDQAFCVNWRDPDRTRATTGKLKIDGIYCGGGILEVPRRLGDEAHKSYAHISATEGRPLQFAALELTDDDAYLGEDAKDVGQIEVVVWRVKIGKEVPFKGVEPKESIKMHEKSKKGLQLAVKFGAKETVPKRKCVDVDYVERLATFIFRYRTITDIPVVGPSATSSSSSPGPGAGRKRRASEALTPEAQDVKPEIKTEIDLVALDEAEERVRQIEEQYRRAKQELEQRRRNKKVKIEEITSFISGECALMYDILGMNIGNLECQVCVDVDGRLEPLEEYGVEHCDTEGSKTCSAWIPSKVGQVVCRDPGKKARAKCCLSTSLYIDGIQRSDGKIFSSSASDEHWHRDVRVSLTERRVVQFGALKLTDDDDILQADTRKYGEITLEVWRARLLDDTRPREGRTFNQGFVPARVHEKAKKGLAHVVVLGEAKKIPSPGSIASEVLDDNPIATFTFHYRSIDVLRAKGIAPSCASQIADTNPLSSDTKPARSQIADVSSAAESRKRKASEDLLHERPLKREVVDIEAIERDREAVRQAEEALRQARLRLYRQEGNDRVKLEDVSTFIQGEVIDLTDD
ncbi:uncharacterized protein SCHCODRAFT_02519383 [Schizophyllum commune H4-8]|uniref:DUF7918 domain-containing protein n=1 Tax=Schizophyllum commune (strain H4-8 / FGSC 9210) TaxID=578458 RepID=D8QI50_SCHCM|nr:uncharacterized protein SCHCODRAFT_02519383 [Schizophyllum commune H4-8]KAI5885859.1 hypothetical protein SCHCODRAFT_02519383 [Schizophyllum commune H4-8]